MKIQGEHTIPVPRETVWKAVLDPEILSGTLPGCEQLEKTGDNEYRGVLNVQVGPVKGRFQGTLEISDLRPPEHYHMKLNGQGPAGFMNGEGDLDLVEEGDATVIHYDLDAQVGGRIAGVGQRLLDSSAKVITRQGLEGLERQLEGVETEPPSQAVFAATFAGGLLAELVPKERRPVVAVVGVAVLAVLVLILIRACG